MASSNVETETFVYADWEMYDSPRLIGTLYYSSVRGKDTYSFEYDTTWLKEGIEIDPELPLFSGRLYSASSNNFGVFQDSAPDRWGMKLIKRREALLAKAEKRPLKRIVAIDFLLGIYDRHRMGGLRYKTDEDGEFVCEDKSLAAPLWTSLRELEHAVEQYEKNADKLDEATLKWINQLFAPGSSLGGARPKADVTDENQYPWIAKFPSKNDTTDIGLWEMIVHDLAVKAGITVPQAQVKQFKSKYHTYLSKRFDRTETGKRIHYSSAMTLLNRSDGDDASEGSSYLDIVELIKSISFRPIEDLEELFHRVMFSVCVSNTDDHLRNHGFLYTENGWMLSPAFDINPNEDGIGLKLNIDEDDNALDIDLVMLTAEYYLISEERAEEIKNEVVNAVKQWRTVAKKHQASESEIALKSPAFNIITNYISS